MHSNASVLCGLLVHQLEGVRSHQALQVFITCLCCHQGPHCGLHNPSQQNLLPAVLPGGNGQGESSFCLLQDRCPRVSCQGPFGLLWNPWRRGGTEVPRDPRLGLGETLLPTENPCAIRNRSVRTSVMASTFEGDPYKFVLVALRQLATGLHCTQGCTQFSTSFSLAN